METLQKLSLPIAIVLAGALIGGAVLYSNAHPSQTSDSGSGAPTWGKQTVQGLQPEDHVLGPKDAKVVIVEYSDPECPFCRIFHTTMQQVMQDYDGKVAWVYRHLPLQQLHPKAPKEAEALECANKLGGAEMFWKYTDKLYATTGSNNSLDDGVYNTPEPVPTGPDGKPYYTEKKPRSSTDAGQLTDMAVSLGLDKTTFESCLKNSDTASLVAADLADGTKNGINGTPTSYVLAGGKQIEIQGAQPIATVKAMIDEALKK
jgi:protein-disulfide isomerase